MGKEDVYESDYLEDPELFADLVNGVLFQGKPIVKAKELNEQDAELRSISKGNVKKLIRDKVRLWKGTLQERSTNCWICRERKKLLFRIFRITI